MCVVCVWWGAGVLIGICKWTYVVECSRSTCLSVWCLDTGVGGVGGWMYMV